MSWVGAGGVLMLCAFLGTILHVLMYRTESAEAEASEGRRKADTIQEDFRTLAKWSSFGIFRTNASGEVTQFNDKWLEIAGLTPEQIRGAGWLEALHPDDRDEVTQAWRDAAASRSHYAREERYLHEDGMIAVCYVQATPVIDEADELLGYVGTVTDVTEHRKREVELEAAKRQLEHIALFDELTGLPNRASCKKDLAQMFASAGEGERFKIIQIDLDNFKRVNDTLGHSAGDHLLHTLGSRLSRFGREFGNFKTYRWGGDEFITLIPGEGGIDVEQLCEELTDVVAIPVDYKGTTIRPTVSLGIARYPEDALDLEALMIFADLALYKTKELGRDGFQFFTPEMKERIDAEAQIERELRVGIDREELVLHYQPQLNVRDGSITGLEALIRWEHPERGLVSPANFLPVVEDSGLAPVVGRLVFDQAMRAIAAWSGKGIEFGRLAVNLSPEHLKQGRVVEDLFGAMKTHDIEARHVAVEFLESFLLDDPHAGTEDILKQMKAAGICVELDDFGTGYASLSHLSTMPINGLKIDRSFVAQVVEDPKKQSIISALISMSRLMDLSVVCEGVETREQIDILSRLGNCSVQGYYIAKPMSFDDATEWMVSKRNEGLICTLPENVTPLVGAL